MAGSSQATSTTEEITALLRERFDPSPLPEPFRLVVIEGVDAGTSFLLDGSQPSRILVGTTPSCTVRLMDRTVSRRHVALDISGRRIRITDVGSTNGTSVNGLAITEAFLEGSEVVNIGATAFRLEREPTAPRIPMSNRVQFGAMLGVSTEMRRLYPLFERLAASDVAVLIEGEPGTGKELLAESLHLEGSRSEGAFVVLDCTSVPSNLLEIELFGHESDAVPGSSGARVGLLEQANGGTLFINEVADLDIVLQQKVQRALERKEIRRIGASQPIVLNVRVIASTRRDLDRDVQAGRFREDLLHLLGVARVELPPLRMRRGDVPLLVRHFCTELAGDESTLSKELRRSWEEHRWPGNVSELRHTVARHLALGELATLVRDRGPSVATDAIEGVGAPQDAFDAAIELPLGEARHHILAEFERRYVSRMLERHRGNVTRAAETAGVARRYFQILKARVSRREKA